MTNIDLGQTIDGSLSSTDTNNPKRLGRFSDDYTLTGISNWQQVQVNLDSDAFDSYLQLVNASTGEVIAFNDDLFSDTRDAGLKFTVIPGVNYVIRATSTSPNQTGNYTFKTSSLGTASSLVVTRNGQEAGTVDSLGRFVSIGNFVEAGSNSIFSDIAFSDDNKLLGIKEDSFPNQLYKINPETGSSSVIGDFPSGVNMAALEFAPGNILYGVSYGSESSNIYRIDPQTGDASSIADFPWNRKVNGDIVFDPTNNRFLFARGSVFGSTLFSVSLTGQSKQIGGIGNIGFNVVGLSFEGSSLVGFTRFDNKRITIDTATGKGTFDSDITGLTDGYLISGAGSIPSATLTPTPTPTPTPLTPTPTPLTPTPTPTPLTPTPTPTPTPLTPTPPPPPAINDTGGASKSIYTVDDDKNNSYPAQLQKVNIKIWEDKNNDGKPDQNPTTPVKNVETYVIIHGFNNDSGQNTATIAALAKQIGSPKEEGGEGKQVILIDWKDAAEASQPGDAAQRISDVAAFSSDVLKRIWKIDNTNINLIGHSLGSLVASEIGLDLGTEDKDVLNSEYRKNPNIDQDKRVNTLIALDPPGDATTFLTSTAERGVIAFFEGYDLDKNRDGTQSPVDFNKVSKFSRAFWGNLLARDGLGKPEFAATADESIYVDFKLPEFNFLLSRDQQSPLANHGNIVYLFSNLLKSNGNIGSLFQLNTPKHTDWQEDAFGPNEAVVTATAKFSFFSDENDPNTEPLLLFAKDSNPKNNDILYGSVGDNTGEKKLRSDFARISLSDVAQRLIFDYPTFNNPGNDKIYGDSGNDEIFGRTGNDTILGGLSNDTIYGEQDNDIIYGGNNNDTIYGGKQNDTLFGDEGDDFLSGDSGNDSLVGGLDNDILIGVEQNNSLLRALGQIDTLIGGGGADLFILGTSNTGTLYEDGNASTNGMNDYALIVDFGNIGGQDTIQLRGTKSQYFLGNSPNGLPVGTGIYLDTNLNQQFDPIDELIAIVQQGGVGSTLGTPVSLNLDASYFKYV
ncbi:hypothetical protein NDI43_12380 [Microcoleus vaginatus GB2-A3]|uniref:hypothetical protein n=1 Tax=Microcoleus vaginatus TaxID=119532 RepID=UPI0032AA9810